MDTVLHNIFNELVKKGKINENDEEVIEIFMKAGLKPDYTTNVESTEDININKKNDFISLNNFFRR